MMATLSSHDTGFGELDNNAICQELSKSAGRKWKLQSTYSNEDRHMKSKYTKNHDPLQAANFSRVSTQQQMNPIVTIS